MNGTGMKTLTSRSSSGLNKSVSLSRAQDVVREDREDNRCSVELQCDHNVWYEKTRLVWELGYVYLFGGRPQV